MLSCLYGPTLTSVHDYWQNHSFDYTDLYQQSEVFIVFNTLSRFIIPFLWMSRHLLILWLKSPSTVILEPKKIKPFTVSIVSPSICHEVTGQDAMILPFWMLSFRPLFHSPLSPSLRGSLVPLCFLPLWWYHLYIWGCWFFLPATLIPTCVSSSVAFQWCPLHRS